MAKQNKKKDSNEKPKVWEFVLVRDEQGNFKYYSKGKFYSFEEIKNILSPKEVEKLKEKEKAAAAEEKAAVEEKEKEIKEMPKEKQDLEKEMLRQIAKKIISELDVKLIPSEKEKIIKIIVSGLRQIRKDVEIKYILTASETAGGLGFNEQKAEKALGLIKKYIPEVEKKRLRILRGELTEIEKAPAPAPEPKPSVTEPPEVARKTLSGLDEKKAVLEDVKKAPELVGPVEELRTMDLVNLRRLGSNKEEIISELMERINLLEDQSVQKKVQGVNAWQQSPVYQMYLDLGYQSIIENKPVENIINEKAAKGERTMTFEEFSAIMEVNGRLQF